MRHLIIGISAVAISIFWGASAYMNYVAGSSYGIDVNQAHMYGAVSVASDILKAFAAFLLGVCIIDRRPVAACVAGFFLLSTAFWSANSAIRFSSENIVGQFQKAQVAETLTKINLQKLEIEKQQIEWLQKQEVSRFHKERKRMTDEINDARKSFDETVKQLEQSDKTTLDANPHYTVLSEIFGIKKEEAAKYVALFFAGLIELVAGLGWFVLFGSRGGKKETPINHDRDTSETVETPVYLNDNNSPETLQTIFKLSPEGIARHFCLNHTWSKRDEPITAKKAHGRYVDTCNKLGVTPLSLTAFGVISTEYVIKRKEKGKVTYYPKQAATAIAA